MRDETVTKKAPKIITSSPNNNLLPIELPGIKLLGNKAMININKRLPMPTTLIEISLSVLGTLLISIFSPLIEPILPLNEEIIVGIVFINVMNPPAATAPAPICLT